MIDQMWSTEDGRRWLFYNAYLSTLQDDQLTETYLVDHRILDNNVRKIASDGNGKTYFLNGYNLSTFDGESWDILNPFPQENSYIWDINAGPDGVIWMSSNYGILTLDQQGNSTYWETGQNGRSPSFLSPPTSGGAQPAQTRTTTSGSPSGNTG